MLLVSVYLMRLSPPSLVHTGLLLELLDLPSQLRLPDRIFHHEHTIPHDLNVHAKLTNPGLVLVQCVSVSFLRARLMWIR